MMTARTWAVGKKRAGGGRVSHRFVGASTVFVCMMRGTNRQKKRKQDSLEVNNSISSHRIHQQNNTRTTTPQQIRILLGFLSFFSASCDVSMGPMGRSQERVCAGASIVVSTAVSELLLPAQIRSLNSAVVPQRQQCAIALRYPLTAPHIIISIPSPSECWSAVCSSLSLSLSGRCVVGGRCV